MTLGNRLDDANHTEKGRLKFFTRVMPIFALMLAITGLVTGAMIELGYASTIAQWGMLGIIGLFIVQIIVYISAEAFRDAWPLNIIFAIVFATFEGIMITPIIALYLSAGFGYIIMQALLLTSVIFFTFAAIPLVTKKDFSFLGGFLIIMVIALIAISLFQMLIGFPTIISLAVSVVSIIVFSLFILYDMTKILQEDWGAVSGAISLYIDFMVIFLNLLQILASTSE